MSKIINGLSKFKSHEQLVLLLCRIDCTEEERDYAEELLQKPYFDYNQFWGITYSNRVNGVIYNNIKKLKSLLPKIQLPLEMRFYF